MHQVNVNIARQRKNAVRQFSYVRLIRTYGYIAFSPQQRSVVRKNRILGKRCGHNDIAFLKQLRRIAAASDYRCGVISLKLAGEIDNVGAGGGIALNDKRA